MLGDTNLIRIHPILGILSSIFGEADMLSYADTYVNNPTVSRPALPFLMYSGIGDTFTPIQTQDALMKSAGLSIVEPGSSIGGSQELAAGANRSASAN